MPPAAITPVKASALAIDVGATAEDAFIAVLDACLRHAAANLPAVLDGQIEGVHQMRVAFRRLRSGLKKFSTAGAAPSQRWVGRGYPLAQRLPGAGARLGCVLARRVDPGV
ncbi:MAG: CHAD domain-containing protein [Candidatus Competibacteraceae bacterium]|nr:CHAD domain-containing protein [Candidatus Competibacteraceae bacterium]